MLQTPTTLNPKQALFVKNYLIDKNGTQAAIRAGYTKNERAAQVQASRLLSNAKVAEEIKRGLSREKAEAEEQAKQACITKERWLESLAAIAFCDVMNFFSQDANGKLTVSIADIKAKGLGHLIRKIRVHPNGEVQFDTHSTLKALELIGKHFGWLGDKSRTKNRRSTPPSPAPVELDAEAAAIARELAEWLSSPRPPKDETIGHPS